MMLYLVSQMMSDTPRQETGAGSARLQGVVIGAVLVLGGFLGETPSSHHARCLVSFGTLVLVATSYHTALTTRIPSAAKHLG